MKATFDIHGYQIVIEETEEGLVTVSALKDDEVVEEFELEGGEDHPGFNSEEEDDFDDLEDDVDDLEDDVDDLEEDDDDDDAHDEEEEEIHHDEEEIQKDFAVESFNQFLRRRR